MTSDIALYHFLILKVLSFFYVQLQCCIKKKCFSIFVECSPHGKFNSEHFMKSNFLALDRYLIRYCTKNPGVILCGRFVDKCSTFLGNILKFRPFASLLRKLCFREKFFFRDISVRGLRIV